ncbi:hypothetical protein Q8A73_015917 [Channa argus]|nr:hypothetical protein Q8A73_015917 [Channa argus]
MEGSTFKEDCPTTHECPAGIVPPSRSSYVSGVRLRTWMEKWRSSAKAALPPPSSSSYLPVSLDDRQPAARRPAAAAAAAAAAARSPLSFATPGAVFSRLLGPPQAG